MRHFMRLGSDLKIFKRLCPHHKLQRGMIVHAFYKGVTQPMQSTIDIATGDTLMNKIEDGTYNLIEEMVLNNYQWSNERS